MKSSTERYSTDQGSVVGDLLRAAVLLVWATVRAAIVIVLAFLEPFVRVLLSGIAVLSLVTGLVYQGSNVTAPIPFWVMLCVSMGCLMFVRIYHDLLRWLSR